MEIKNYKTKFNLEDVVWFMYDNKPSQGIIHRIKYTQEEVVDTRFRHKDIFHKIKSFLSGKYVERFLVYTLDMVSGDGTFKSTPHYKQECEIFKTKEELLKSL